MTRTPNELTETPKRELLTEVLRRVRVSSATFLRGEFTAPWCLDSTDEATMAMLLAPGAKRIVLLHLAIEGSFRVRVDPDDDEGMHIQTGEAVVLPYCDNHTMAFPEFKNGVPIVNHVPMPPWAEMPVQCIVDGKEGPQTRIVCGYLYCDDLLFDTQLRALPRMIHVKKRAEAAAQQWRESSLQYAVEQMRTGGSPELLARLPELVLVDCLQQYADSLPASRGGWLASLEDPVVGRALKLLHGSPFEDWTVERLAKEAGVSRSILADRFTDAIGQPPIRYLAQWRLQLAADLVRSTDLGIAEIASRVGYESEASFSRAFKRQHGKAPGIWRDTVES